MKKSLYILFFLLISANLFSQTNIEIDYRHTEWASDTIYDLKEERWRDFILFDSLLNFTRASWWSEEYILDRGKLRNNDSIISLNGDYTLEVLDSNTIVISNDSYYGRFRGNPWKFNKYFDRYKTRFEVGDSIKKILLGIWHFDSLQVKFDESIQIFDSIPMPEELKDRFHSFYGKKLNDSLSFNFSIDNILLVDDLISPSTKYSYKVDNEEIDLSKSDYVIGIDYKLIDDNHLKLIKKNGLGKTYIYLQRTK
jgi:hypothetical protein